MTDPARPGSDRRGRRLGRGLDQAATVVLWPVRTLFGVMATEAPPLELQLVGRTLLQALAVGLSVGLAGCLMLLALEVVEGAVIDHAMAAPYLRAVGEDARSRLDGGQVRLYLLCLLPVVGGLVAGVLTRLAPEVRGGGGDAMIDAFHREGGAVRRRVIPLKAMASIATLGTGGAGGREGPTMHLGAALGAWVAGLLPTSARERRVLMVAGVAAGISAVFRTPLGAALLSIEVLYRDDFESDALIPAVLASVVGYSLSASILSTAPMFGDLPRFPFHWEQLPLYAATALIVALAASGFVALLRATQRACRHLPGPRWATPAWGALGLGLVAIAALLLAGRLHVPAAFLGVLGGGYGAGQLAISGDAALGAGLTAAGALLVAAALRALATAFTVGSGGSGGDFAPSLALGALVGGACGHAAAAWFAVPGVSPSAFALVGMATFYGGIAKVPLAATIMVCEMAGSYDLLVPLMLAQGVAIVALRRVVLYPAQVATQRSSPAHVATWTRYALARVTAGELIARDRPIATLAPDDDAETVLRVVADAVDQAVFPVVDRAGALCGLVTGAGTREIAAADESPWAIAADLMMPPVSVAHDRPLAEVAQVLVEHDLRAVPVVDGDGRMLGLLDEHAVSRAYVEAEAAVRRAATAAPIDAGDGR